MKLFKNLLKSSGKGFQSFYLSIGILFFVLSFFQCRFFQRYQSELIVTSAAAELKESPSDTSNTIQSLKFGDKITILEESKRLEYSGEILSKWVKVKLDSGSSGWIFGSNIGEVPTEEILSSATWTTSNGFGFIPVFKNGEVTVTFSGEGCGLERGTYKIDSGRVNLELTQTESDCSSSNLNKKSCVLKEIYTTDQRTVLDCGEAVYFHTGRKVSAGTLIHIKGIDGKIIDEPEIILAKPTAFYSAPSTASAKLVFLPESMNGSNENPELLPEGFAVYPEAKTTSLSETWYLVTFGCGWYDQCPEEGWITEKELKKK